MFAFIPEQVKTELRWVFDLILGSFQVSEFPNPLLRLSKWKFGGSVRLSSQKIWINIYILL